MSRILMFFPPYLLNNYIFFLNCIIYLILKIMFFIVKMVKKCRRRLMVVSLPIKRNIMRRDIENLKVHYIV